MINKKNMIKKWILAITVASMTMNAAIFTVPAKTSSNVAAKSKTTPEKKGEATGTWYGNIFGIAVVLDIKNDGTYDIKFEDKNKETGVWCLNGDNIVTDKDSDAETTYTFNGSSLITKINGETLKLTKNRTNAVKKVSSTSNKNVDEEDFNGVWKANKVEIGKLSAKPDTFGITNAFLKIKDKKADYLGLGKEDNPALGYRAIRICLEQPDIFKTQLRALLRAAKYGNLSIMYPMIISVEEVVSIKKIVAEVAKELENENIPYEIPEQGIMIETPAAVMLSEELAELVDFFSIGTNDLTQYTLAIDRQNNRLDRFYNPHHEAVLRMIEMTIQGAHKHGKWVGICGELGADTTLTERFIKMGIDELSVSPSMVLGVRSRICEME